MTFLSKLGLAQRRPEGNALFSPGWQAAWFGLIYFAGAWLSDLLSAKPGYFENFWLPAGLYTGVLLISKYRHWPGLLLAALAANFAFDLLHGTRFLLTACFYCAGTLEAITGAGLMRRLASPRPTLGTLREFFWLLVLCAGFSTFLGAVVGAAGLVGFGAARSFWDACLRWQIDNAMSILLVTPFVLVWLSPAEASNHFPPRPRKLPEAALLVAGLCALTWFIFVVEVGVISPNKSWLILFLLWAGWRFGVRGATAANLLLALLSAFLVAHFRRGLAPADLATGGYALILQLFLAVAAIVALIPAIVLRERDRTLSELHDSEERFRNLTAAAFEGICISENGMVLDVNNQFLAMFGYSNRAEIIGQKIVDKLVAPESRETVAQAIRTGQESNYEHRLQRKDGSYFQAEARARVLQVGRRTLRMTAVRDVTERKLAEQALRESEEKFSKAFRTSPNAMSISDFETGRYLEVNDAHETVFGYPRAEVIGRSPFELEIVMNDPVVAEIRRQLQQEGGVRSVEIQARNRQGKPLTLLHSAELINLSGHQCVLRVSHDITERKLAEQELRVSREKYFKAFRNSPDAITITRMSDGRIIEANEGFQRVFGHPPETAVGRTTFELQLWTTPADRLAVLKEVEHTGFVRDREIPFRTRDGQTRMALVSAEKIEIGGEACMLTVAHDITERMASEAARADALLREQQARAEYTLQLIASQEAERARIAAGLHDSLGQNLLLIKNRVQLTLVGEPLPAGVRDQLEGINQLAAQAIAEARQIAYDLHPHQLDHLGLTRALEAMIDNAAESTGIVFERQLDNVDDLFPKDAATNLYRVVQESLNNVVKHSGARNARISLERDVHEVQLRIADDGRGFSITGPINAGKGLGLRNIAERVRILGGKIKLESQPGRGTQLEVVIPIAGVV